MTDVHVSNVTMNLRNDVITHEPTRRHLRSCCHLSVVIRSISAAIYY
jgi:hypothetical protein